jgi:hypothetical protein
MFNLRLRLSPQLVHLCHVASTLELKLGLLTEERWSATYLPAGQFSIVTCCGSRELGYQVEKEKIYFG